MGANGSTGTHVQDHQLNLGLGICRAISDEDLEYRDEDSATGMYGEPIRKAMSTTKLGKMEAALVGIRPHRRPVLGGYPDCCTGPGREDTNMQLIADENHCGIYAADDLMKDYWDDEEEENSTPPTYYADTPEGHLIQVNLTNGKLVGGCFLNAEEAIGSSLDIDVDAPDDQRVDGNLYDEAPAAVHASSLAVSVRHHQNLVAAAGHGNGGQHKDGTPSGRDDAGLEFDSRGPQKPTTSAALMPNMTSTEQELVQPLDLLA